MRDVSSCAGVLVLEVWVGVYEGKSVAAAAIYEVTWRWAPSSRRRSCGCDFKLEGDISLKCRVRELKYQGELLIWVLKFPLTFANACCKEILGFELNPPNPL